MGVTKITDHVARALARLPHQFKSGDTFVAAIVSANELPVAAFSEVLDGLEATFTDESTDIDGSVVSWSWDFGDSNTSTTQHPVHTYAGAGTYTVTLTVTDNEGGVDTTDHDVSPSSAWTIDVTKLVPVPQTIAEMDALLASVGVSSGGPTHGYLAGKQVLDAWKIQKTSGGAAAFDAGVSSVTTIAGDGWVECEVGYELLKGRLFGFSDSDPDVSFTTMDFSIYLEESGARLTFSNENGVLVNLLSPHAPGDKYRVKRTGTTITYEKMAAGATSWSVLRTSGGSSSGAVLIDVSFYSILGTVQGIKLYSGVTAIPITWNAGTNVTLTAGSFVPDLATSGPKDFEMFNPPTSWAVARAGWASLFMKMTASTASYFGANTWPNVNLNPYLLIFRAGIDAVGGQSRSVVRVGDLFDDDAAVEISTTPRVQLGEGFGAARKVGTQNPITGLDVCTFVLLIDPVDLQGCVVYTSQEKISSPFGADDVSPFANGQYITFGGDFSNTWYPPTMDILDLWVFEGAAARKTKPEIRAIIGALEGVTPPMYSWNMTKNSPSAGGYDAGASSVQTFAGDVYVEATIGTTGDCVAWGFSPNDPNQDYATIDFAILNDGGAMWMYENGVGTNLATAAVLGDKWRVSREGTVVKVYKNGAFISNFTASSSGAILVDTALRLVTDQILDITVVVGGVEQAITWTNIVNAHVY